jgi:serralysin
MRAQLLALCLLLAPVSASAAFHLWDITEVYSNASGTVQFVELETCNTIACNGEQFISNHTITSNSTVFTFLTDLPGATQGRKFLIATPAFASQPGAVPPDYTFAAANFMSTVADTLNFAGVDIFTYNVGALPTNGVSSLNEPFGSNVRTTAANTPTNFAGQVGPEPSAWLLQLAGAATVFVLAHRRTRAQRL